MVGANEHKFRNLDWNNKGSGQSAIKRFGRREKWDVSAVLDMKGTPQRPDPTKFGLHIPVQIRLEPEVPFSMPAMKPVPEEERPRRPYIMKRHFEEFKYTEECEGCARLSTGRKSEQDAAGANLQSGRNL